MCVKNCPQQGTFAAIKFQKVVRALTLLCDVVAMKATAAAVQFRTEPGLAI